MIPDLRPLSGSSNGVIGGVKIPLYCPPPAPNTAGGLNQWYRKISVKQKIHISSYKNDRHFSMNILP
jgi:hypothetical protein